MQIVLMRNNRKDERKEIERLPGKIETLKTDRKKGEIDRL